MVAISIKFVIVEFLSVNELCRLSAIRQLQMGLDAEHPIMTRRWRHQSANRRCQRLRAIRPVRTWPSSRDNRRGRSRTVEKIHHADNRSRSAWSKSHMSMPERPYHSPIRISWLSSAVLMQFTKSLSSRTLHPSRGVGSLGVVRRC